MYPDSRVETLIRDNFIPVRIHVRDPNATALMERFGANWTPTILILDSQRVERHRIEGFLPLTDFLGRLTLALGHAAFGEKRWADAEKWFAQVLERFPESEAAPEAQYWKGVARYKASGDGAALAETARAFRDRYADSTWAKKASVWQ